MISFQVKKQHLLIEWMERPEQLNVKMVDDEFHEEELRSLLISTLNESKRSDGKYCVCFTEEDRLMEQKEILEAGFECVSEYLCYGKQL